MVVLHLWNNNSKNTAGAVTGNVHEFGAVAPAVVTEAFDNVEQDVVAVQEYSM